MALPGTETASGAVVTEASAPSEEHSRGDARRDDELPGKDCALASGLIAHAPELSEIPPNMTSERTRPPTFQRTKRTTK